MTTPQNGQLLGYARVSTGEQDAQLQRDALTTAGCAKIYEDTGSGKSLTGRPRLADMLAYAREGDVIVCWKLDRIARSVVDLINTVDALQARGIGFRVLTGALSGIDTTTPDGRLFLTLISAMAEFERSLILERTHAGLAAAKAQGRVSGRPRALDEDQIAAARARRARGESPTQIAAALKCSRATVYRVLDEQAA